MASRTDSETAEPGPRIQSQGKSRRSNGIQLSGALMTERQMTDSPAADSATVESQTAATQTIESQLQSTEFQTVDSQTAQSQTGTSKIAGSHQWTADEEYDEQKRVSTKITSKGKYLSLCFLVCNIFNTYSQRYTNLFVTVDANGISTYLGNSDIIWLYSISNIGRVLMYLFQSNSMWRDMTKKQFSLMFIREFLALVTMWLNFAAVWSIGITIKKTLGSASLVSSSIIDSVVFGKLWYVVDGVSVGMCLFAILLTMISQYKPSSADDEALNTAFFVGCGMRLCGAITDSLMTALTEYICKIDYPRQMVTHFGEDHERGDTMPPLFFLGVSGVIGVILNIIFGVLFSVLPGNAMSHASNGQMGSIVDTATKIMNSKSLSSLIIITFVVINLYRYFKVTTATEVSSLATFLIKRAAAIPLFLLNVMVLTKPSNGEPLEHFDPKLWSQWLLVLALLYSFVALPIYYEIGIAKRWRRPHTSPES